MTRRRGLLPIPLIALALAASVAVSAGADHHPAKAAAKRAYTATVAYKETDGGTDDGSGATKGIVGRGSFSAKLGPAASIAARLIGAATGVPLADIAKGGAYAVRRNIDKNGKITGTMVVKLKGSGLGTTCLGYTEKPGRFNGGSFVPMSGTLKTLGGKGQAAKWRASIAFDQTDVTGQGTEQFKARGSAHVSTGPKQGFSAACKSVAKLPRG